ncbi:hypothetical protein NLN86_23380 [Citrobacter portucalensis]|uniref:Uncharacterized protein n=1 Tax=Citrobacter portucalensis TaxID=1639133 RepID=A0AAW5W816_9ENTR|nr:hypothetical protein [Citrobacter portucalensis]MCX9004563.1 hypothetical protein [Citrobacter portucalensis]
MKALNKQELRELRAAFQSWWKTQRSVCQFSRIQSYEGPYRSKAVQSAWEVWQAAHGSKLEAAEKRIAELEARTVTLPPKEHDNGTDSQIDINAGFANRMWQKCADAIRAAGIGVKGD